MRQVVFIAANTFRELLRQPFFLLLTTVSALFTVFLACVPSPPVVMAGWLPACPPCLPDPPPASRNACLPACLSSSPARPYRVPSRLPA